MKSENIAGGKCYNEVGHVRDNSSCRLIDPRLADLEL
jgi:hypothetical protein